MHLGPPEAALEHEAGLITKTEIRAVVLAKLQLLPGLVLWDVGAGCGSVGLEAESAAAGGAGAGSGATPGAGPADHG